MTFHIPLHLWDDNHLFFGPLFSGFNNSMNFLSIERMLSLYKSMSIDCRGKRERERERERTAHLFMVSFIIIRNTFIYYLLLLFYFKGRSTICQVSGGPTQTNKFLILANKIWKTAQTFVLCRRNDKNQIRGPVKQYVTIVEEGNVIIKIILFR